MGTGVFSTGTTETTGTSVWIALGVVSPVRIVKMSEKHKRYQ
jgi:hypothetical protein